MFTVWGLVCGCVLGTAVAAMAQPISPSPHLPISLSPFSVFRVFLTDGRVVHSHGECAPLPDELVCVVKMGGGDVAETHDLLTVPITRVDMERTTAYARAVRAALYGATRGEREYAELTTDVARMLAELKASTDRDRRLGIAQVARRRLESWSGEHFGYRAAETRQLVSLLDEVIAELRVAAGETTFALDFAASLAPMEEIPTWPVPDLAESVEAALVAASVTPVAAERLALLRSAHRLTLQVPALDATLRSRVTATLRAEEAVEREYQALRADAIARADVAVRRGRASVMQRLIREVEERDVALGGRRPREMEAFKRRLTIELALATEQQAAFARWEQIKEPLLAYERRLRPVLDGWVSQRPVLRQLEARGVPSRSDLDRAVRRFIALESSLAALRPLPEVQEVHALFQSAVQMARHGLAMGQRLTVAANVDIAHNASSAVAGAELLLAQARRDLVPALNPRKVR